MAKILKIYNKKVDIVLKEEFFYENFDRYFQLHMTMPVKLIIIFTAFGLSPLLLIYIFMRDLNTGFIDTIRTKGVTLFQYLFVQFVWSWLTIHLLLTLIAFGAFVFELDLIFCPTMIVSLFVGMILMSYDMHISCNISTLLIGNALASAVNWIGIHTIAYLLVVSELEPLTSIRFYTYPTLFWYIRAFFFIIVPGTHYI